MVRGGEYYLKVHSHFGHLLVQPSEIAEINYED